MVWWCTTRTVEIPLGELWVGLEEQSGTGGAEMTWRTEKNREELRG